MLLACASTPHHVRDYSGNRNRPQRRGSQFSASWWAYTYCTANFWLGDRADGETLRGFVRQNSAVGTSVYSDEARAYVALRDMGYGHKAVRHAAGEYVKRASPR